METYLNNIYEKVAIIGLDPEIEHEYSKLAQNLVKPILIDLFPIQSFTKNIDNFLMWCYPDEFLIYNEKFQPINQDLKDNKFYNQSLKKILDLLNSNSIHHFTLCDEKLKVSYCSCLTVYEKFYTKKDGQSLKLFYPKTLVLFSHQPLTESNTIFLNFLYKNLFLPKIMNKQQNIKIAEDLFFEFQEIYSKYGIQQAVKEWDNQYKQIKERIDNYDIKSRKFFQFDHEGLLEFFISILFSKQQFPIDTQRISIISPSLKAINSEIIKINNGSKYFSLNNFCQSPIFKKMSIKNLLEIIYAILIEKQIIIYGTNDQEILNSCECLIELIFPIKYKGFYIPLLPKKMQQTHLKYKGSFIVGIKYKQNLKQEFEENLMKLENLQNKFYFDLDNNNIFHQQQFCFQNQKLNDYVIDGVQQIIKKGTNEDQQLQYLSFKRIIFNFIWGIINNILPYFLYSEINEEDLKIISKDDIFDYEEYTKIFDNEEKQLMKELLKTKSYNLFLIECYKILYKTEFKKQKFQPKDSYEEKLLYFIKFNKKLSSQLSKKNQDCYIDIMTNPYFLSLEVDNKMEIRKQLELMNQAFVVDLQQHLVKYISQLAQINKNEYKNQNPFIEKNFNCQIIKPFDKKKLQLLQLQVQKVKQPQQVEENKQITEIQLKQAITPIKETITINPKVNSSQKKQYSPQRVNVNLFQQQLQNPLKMEQQLYSTNMVNSKKSLQNMEISFAQQCQNSFQDNTETNGDIIPIQKPVPSINKELLDYDTYQCRQFIHEFEKLNMKYPKQEHQRILKEQKDRSHTPVQQRNVVLQAKNDLTPNRKKHKLFENNSQKQQDTDLNILLQPTNNSYKIKQNHDQSYTSQGSSLPSQLQHQNFDYSYDSIPLKDAWETQNQETNYDYRKLKQTMQNQDMDKQLNFAKQSKIERLLLESTNLVAPSSNKKPNIFPQPIHCEKQNYSKQQDIQIKLNGKDIYNQSPVKPSINRQIISPQFSPRYNITPSKTTKNKDIFSTQTQQNLQQNLIKFQMSNNSQIYNVQTENPQMRNLIPRNSNISKENRQNSQNIRKKEIFGGEKILCPIKQIDLLVNQQSTKDNKDKDRQSSLDYKLFRGTQRDNKRKQLFDVKQVAMDKSLINQRQQQNIQLKKY